ncbi:MAG TPA: hypothetical protein VHD85_22505 [Terracidiphilus sp.]|nr:hypothetical protein [Terracidiphilus sp.]
MRMGLAALALCGAMGFAVSAAAAPSQWEQPAAALAGQIAGILGPGQAQLTIRNISSIANSDLAPIRRLIEQDLKTHGVTISGAEGANAIRVTLSESARQRVWVAEVMEGDQTQVTMVDLPLAKAQQAQVASGVVLRKEQILAGNEPILAALEVAGGLVALEPQEIVIYANTANGWQAQQRVNIPPRLPLARDPRGVLLPAADGTGFEGFLAGIACMGVAPTAGLTGNWSVQCHGSDDPWTIIETSSQGNGPVIAIKAFYNASRDFFSGVVTPSLGADLPAFYSAALQQRAAGNAALVIAGIDGKVRLVGNGTLATVAGTRDWGSDIAVLRSGCGAGTQVIASGSGEAVSDSLRAYDMPALEAVPASPPLAMEGTVTAMWTAPDGKSVLAVVRKAANQYEVDRVTALCN